MDNPNGLAMSQEKPPGFGLSTTEVKRRQILAKSLLVGVVAGLLASAFRLSLTFAERTRIAFFSTDPSPWKAAVAVGLGALGGGLGIWLVRAFAPEAAGSGIPHLK